MRRRSLSKGRESLVSLIKEYLDVLRTNRSRLTYEHAKYTLGLFESWCSQNGVQRLYELDRHKIRRYVQYLNGLGKSKSTVWSYCCTVRAFLNWCVQEEILDDPVYRKGDFPAKPHPHPDPMTPNEILKLIDATKSARYPWIAARDRAMIYVLLHTGVRRGELAQMKVGDVERMVSVVTQKGGRAHAIFLNGECVLEIRRYLRLYTREIGRDLSPNEALWRTLPDNPLSEHGIHQIFQRLSERTGIHVWCHRFRQTSATLRLSSGASTELVRTALGHCEERSILHYVKLAQDDIARLMDETSPLKALKRRNKLP